MASPQVIVFFLFDENTGAPFTGATPSFDTSIDTNGGAVTAPAVTEIGGGAYKFTPVFPVDKGLAFVINGGAGTSPRRQSLFLRPEDYNADILTDLKDEAFGKWEIKTSGPDANRMIFYKIDGVTVLKKYDLKDENSNPTATDPFSRTPV